MFDIIRYTPDKADIWNRFVAEAKNGTFLFDRNYMDYHSDRFNDHSLMFYEKNRLLAVLPGHISGDGYFTHKGLTYGGLLYHVCKARMVARDYSTNIFLRAGLRWERVRRRGVVRAQKAGLTVRRSDHYADFWKVLSDNLGNKYGIKPVHSLQEIELLRSRFPENIILYEAVKDGQVIAGVVLYLSSQVVHAQYSSATPEGKSLGAIDLIYEQIMLHDYVNYPYFDFGRSTENPDGSGLNESLAFQKEGFGGRGLCYDIYEYDL